jgi:hypothetical protein
VLDEQAHRFANDVVVRWGNMPDRVCRRGHRGD